MSHRPIEKKKVARLRKLLRRTPPARINLVEWLKDRRYARTTGEAHRLLLDGKVKSESHPVGTAFEYDKEGRRHKVVAPLVSAELRKTLQVLP